MPEDRVRPSQIQRIPPSRDLTWIKDLYEFVERIPEYYLLNEIRLTAPFPGGSRYNEQELQILTATAAATGVDLTLTLPAPPRGTHRLWIVLNATTDSTVSVDAHLAFQFGGQVFRLQGDGAFTEDDPIVVGHFLACSGMVIEAFWRDATNTKTYNLTGLHIDFPEGEVQGVPPFTTAVAG